MDELCPLCLKMGLNKQIRAVQINLDEAVWMCENEECPWPFGHQVPEFLPRKVGDQWAYEWEIYKKVQKGVGPIPVSTELSLYTPPVTPNSEAIAKDSTKLDISRGTLISDINSSRNNIFASNSLPNDGYAPKSDEKVWCEGRHIVEDCTSSAKKITSEGTAVCTLGQTSSILPSIFDIDGDELFSNKFSIKQSCVKTETTVCKSEPLDTLDVRNTETIINSAHTVLEKSKRSKMIIPKSTDTKRNVISCDTHNDILVKGIPHVRSISRTNFDLLNVDSKRFIKSDVTKPPIKIESTNDVQDISSKPPIKIESTNDEQDNSSKPPIKIESTNDEQDNSSKLQSLENTNGRCISSRQHTTTITVDGILPITLSYDLADLHKQIQEAGPVTSTPVPERLKRNLTECRSEELDGNLELQAVSARKQPRFAAKRRAGIATRYEKFNFSALKKSVPESKQCNERTSTVLDSSIVASSESIKVKEVRKKEDKPSSVDQLVPSGFISPLNKSKTTSLNPHVSASIVEPLNGANINPNSSVISLPLKDEPSSEHFNFNSVLDDILIEGFQNATENLNDDWLESFFTSDI